MFLQDNETVGDMKEEETNYQDVKKEIPWSEIVTTTSHIQKVRQSCRGFFIYKEIWKRCAVFIILNF